MKKIFKLFGVLLAFAMVVGLSSCGDVLGSLGNPDNNSGTTGDNEYYNNPIEHTFVKDAKDVGSFIGHYNAENSFTYGEHTNCYYQIEFTYASPVKFTLYTRKKGSMELIEKIAKGTVAGDPWKEGFLTFTTVEGQNVFQTVTIKKDANNVLYFNGDVSVTHKAIHARDDK